MVGVRGKEVRGVMVGIWVVGVKGLGDPLLPLDPLQALTLDLWRRSGVKGSKSGRSQG